MVNFGSLLISISENIASNGTMQAVLFGIHFLANLPVFYALVLLVNFPMTNPTNGPNNNDINIIGIKSFGFVADTANAIGIINKVDITKPFIIEFLNIVVFDIIYAATNQKAITESILNNGAFTKKRGIKSKIPAIKPTNNTISNFFMFHLRILG